MIGETSRKKNAKKCELADNEMQVSKEVEIITAARMAEQGRKTLSKPPVSHPKRHRSELKANLATIKDLRDRGKTWHTSAAVSSSVKENRSAFSSSGDLAAVQGTS